MQEATSKLSVLLSIFKRKGGEGLLTKIVTQQNKLDYKNQLAFLPKNENAILCFKKDEFEWLILTDKRLLQEKDGKRMDILLSKLEDVSPAFDEEYSDGIKDLASFTRLVLKDSGGNRYVIGVEKGDPFRGFNQILHHIISKRQRLS